MHWFWTGFYHALLMGWETFWALVLGFGISAALQTFVPRTEMARLFGATTPRSVLLATGLGAASSSCSYAAVAAARSAVQQGAALIPALAFMFASTNLVIELGAVLWVLLGWRFLLAEVIGSFLLIAVMWLLAKLIFPRDLNATAQAETRKRAEGEEESDCCHGHSPEHVMHPETPGSGSGALAQKWVQLAGAFVMDWQMLWKEIVIGFLIAGYLSVLIPENGWKLLFLSGGPGWLRILENALLGPLIAMASFVCSVGNLPLANLLWSQGISFGGVVSFIFGDLLIVPLLLAYRKAYGARTAGYIIAVLYLSMVAAAIMVDLIFAACGWIPTGPRPPSAMLTMHFQWNYTTWLDLLALPFGGWLCWIYSHGRRTSGSAGTSGDLGAHAHHH